MDELILAAIDKFNRFIKACKEEHTGRVLFTIDDAKYAFIKAVESVEPVHGEWIKHENPKGIFSRECSVCGCWFSWDGLPRNSFCPNCGADMRGDTE